MKNTHQYIPHKTKTVTGFRTVREGHVTCHPDAHRLFDQQIIIVGRSGRSGIPWDWWQNEKRRLFEAKQPAFHFPCQTSLCVRIHGDNVAGWISAGTWMELWSRILGHAVQGCGRVSKRLISGSCIRGGESFPFIYQIIFYTSSTWRCYIFFIYFYDSVAQTLRFLLKSKSKEYIRVKNINSKFRDSVIYLFEEVNKSYIFRDKKIVYKF